MLVAGGSSARLLDEARIAFAPVDRDKPSFSPLREMASEPTERSIPARRRAPASCCSAWFGMPWLSDRDAPEARLGVLQFR